MKLMLLYFSMIYLKFLYDSNDFEKLYDAPFFWINTAILFFNASTLYISIFENYLKTDGLNIYLALWPILQISGIIYYGLFTLGIWKLKY